MERLRAEFLATTEPVGPNARHPRRRPQWHWYQSYSGSATDYSERDSLMLDIGRHICWFFRSQNGPYQCAVEEIVCLQQIGVGDNEICHWCSVLNIAMYLVGNKAELLTKVATRAEG